MKKYEAFAMPIGTIISSFLTWEQFQTSVSISKWTSASEWAPCDGRPIDNSIYYHITNRDSSPDLRGVFLRGLNIFDLAEKTQVPPAQENTDEPAFGTMQEDAFQGHWHHLGNQSTKTVIGARGLESSGPATAPAAPGNPPTQIVDTALDAINDTKHGVPNTANETRPKNLSVYYYIKIN